MLGNVDAFSKPSSSGPSSGSSSTTGMLYDLQGATVLVPAYNQYLVAGRIVLPSTSQLKIQGQAVII